MLVPAPETLPVRLLLAGDSALTSTGLRALLEQVAEVEVLDLVDDPHQLSARVEEYEPRPS